MLSNNLTLVYATADGSRISIDVVNGDLTQENTDAIVNVLNEDMDMSRGRLNKALAIACGPQVQEECNELGWQPPGSAVVTSGGNLNVPYIIHIVPGSKNLLKNCLVEGLRLADQKRFQSISIPAIGTGNFKMSAADSAKLIFQALANVCGSFSSITKVRMVVYQPEMVQTFQLEQQKHSVPPFKLASNRSSADGRSVSIDVVNGDLTEENTDAIVNVLNEDMDMSRGQLNKALAKACGPRVRQECNELGWQAPGSAVVTSGGNLNVPYIIHIVPGSKNLLKNCLEEGLRLADQKRFQSISIPAIGTGNFKMSAADSAKLIFQALANVCGRFSSVSKVRIVVYQPEMVQTFQLEQQKHSLGPLKLASNRYLADNRRVSIDIVNGDLTQENTDAIVNVLNTDMDMSRGRLNKVLAKACGPQVQQECNELGWQAPGSAVMTSGGNLNVPYIIHIVPDSSKKPLKNCLEEGLRLADQNRLQSISIPAIGTGNFRMPATKSAKLVFKALRNVQESFVNISKVRIVVFEGGLIEAFQQEMTRLDTQYFSRDCPGRAFTIEQSCKPTMRALERLISNMVEWSYESGGRKTAFDLETNAKLEMAQSKKDSTVQVTLREKIFVVDLKTLNGRCHRDGEEIKINREPKQGEHCKGLAKRRRKSTHVVRKSRPNGEASGRKTEDSVWPGLA